MICLHIKYHMHNTEGLSDIFIKMKPEGSFCLVIMLIFYILQLSKFMKDAHSLKVCLLLYHFMTPKRMVL